VHQFHQLGLHWRLILPSLRILSHFVRDGQHSVHLLLLETCPLSRKELRLKLDCGHSPAQDALLNHVSQHFLNQESLMLQFTHPKDEPVRHELLASPYGLLQKLHWFS
jgi:hypothetical protein